MLLAILLAFWTGFSAVFAHPLYDAPAHRRRDGVIPRPQGDLAKRDVHSGVRATWYGSGMTACGVETKDSDFIVAISSQLFGPQPGKHCSDPITITHNGKTAHATVTDLCEICPLWGLDMSPGLFKFFADPDTGVLEVDWYFDNQGPSDETTTMKSVVYTSTSHTMSHPHTMSQYTATHRTTSETYQEATSTSSATSTTSAISMNSTNSTNSTTSTTSHATSRLHFMTKSHATKATITTTATAPSMTPMTPIVSADKNIEAINLLMVTYGHLVASGPGL